INKMDRVGADPYRVVEQLNDKLACGAILMQLPIGKESDFCGVIDLVKNNAVYFDGEQGEKIRIEAIPSDLVKEADVARRGLLETLAMFSDEMMELLLEEQTPPVELIHSVVRLAVWSRQLTPVFLATAYKNKGVQPLIDAVVSYLPSPLDCDNYAWRSGHENLQDDEKSEDGKNENNKLLLKPDSNEPVVAMAFKIIEDPYGTLTFMRIYQGMLKKGESYFNQRTGNKERISRIFRMHADSREEIESAGAGDIVAVIGIDCSSGDTFAAEKDYCTLESMYVPDPVIRIAIRAKATKDADRLSKALYRFRKEDPTLSISTDQESGETLMAGMGELHLDVYVERIRREYKVDVETSPPKVNYREAPTIPVDFDIKHKKQSGGSGQYAHIVGRMSPIPEDADTTETFIFEEKIVGGTIPSNYIPAIEKGLRSSLEKGPVAGFPVVGLSVLVDDGSFHTVDSSDLAFRICAQTALRETFPRMKPTLLEPVMKMEIECPSQFQGNVVGDLNSRRGIINVTETVGAITRIEGEIPLAETFGYSTTLRSMTQGQGTFSMEFLKYKKVPSSIQEVIIKERKEAAAGK
ncbi:MAG: elongation factor G, partial [Planctomycetaceae bacterium]|nr:elongation factor G [Planctomycetaceae bacterium]